MDMLRHDDIAQDFDFVLKAQARQFVEDSLSADGIGQVAMPPVESECDESGGAGAFYVSEFGHDSRFMYLLSISSHACPHHKWWVTKAKDHNFTDRERQWKTLEINKKDPGSPRARG